MTSGPKRAIDTTRVTSLRSEGLVHKTASFPAFAAALGQHLLFTGHSGTGKSTLLALISGLQKPRNGNICINDININQLRETDRRRLFYYQGAETVIFAGRFKSVLTFGCNHKIDASRLERAICDVGLEATVNRIGGWQAQVAENGQNLSATEILKVALCRLLLTRAKVVVVDDIDRFMANQDCRHGLDVLLAQKDKLVVATAHSSAPFHAQFTHIHALDKASVLPINAALAEGRQAI